MPRFHLNSLTGDGEELPSVAAAHRVAERSAREALIEAVRTGDTAPNSILVTDGEGREVATVFLKDLLDASVRSISTIARRSRSQHR